jgi:hypothetical protein
MSQLRTFSDVACSVASDGFELVAGKAFHRLDGHSVEVATDSSPSAEATGGSTSSSALWRDLLLDVRRIERRGGCIDFSLDGGHDFERLRFHVGAPADR